MRVILVRREVKIHTPFVKIGEEWGAPVAKRRNLDSPARECRGRRKETIRVPSRDGTEIDPGGKKMADDREPTAGLSGRRKTNDQRLIL
jgi:hypothetical protein